MRIPSNRLALYNRLSQLVGSGAWQALPDFFASLSNAQFRLGGPLLAQAMAERLDADGYWQLSLRMVEANAKAFLVTLVKGALAHGVSPEGEGFEAFCSGIRQRPLDVQKTAQLLLPTRATPQAIEQLLRLLGVDESDARVGLLLRLDGNAAAYVLFHTLRFAEADRPLLTRTVQYLVRRGDDRSFNFASLLRAYFGLETEVKATFSLRIEPYQLARLEGSYEAFCQALGR